MHALAAVTGLDLGEIQERDPQINDPYATTAMLSGLLTNTKYRIYIWARTVKGRGEGYFIEIVTSKAGGELLGLCLLLFHCCRRVCCVCYCFTVAGLFAVSVIVCFTVAELFAVCLCCCLSHCCWIVFCVCYCLFNWCWVVFCVSLLFVSLLLGCLLFVSLLPGCLLCVFVSLLLGCLFFVSLLLGCLLCVFVVCFTVAWLFAVCLCWCLFHRCWVVCCMCVFVSHFYLVVCLRLMVLFGWDCWGGGGGCCLFPGVLFPPGFGGWSSVMLVCGCFSLPVITLLGVVPYCSFFFWNLILSGL